MPRKILTVDDYITVRETVSDTLKGAGLEVLEAEGRLKALGVLSTPRIDLIITDMPNMDGMTLVKRVRASGSHTSMPILTTEPGTIERPAIRRPASRAGSSSPLLRRRCSPSSTKPAPPDLTELTP